VTHVLEIAFIIFCYRIIMEGVLTSVSFEFKQECYISCVSCQIWTIKLNFIM